MFERPASVESRLKPTAGAAMMGRPQRGGARGGRKVGTSLLDLRVLLVGMCVLSFVLTFLYVDDFDARASSDGRVTRQVAAPDGRLATLPVRVCPGRQS
jgi:hypothetical protein